MTSWDNSFIRALPADPSEERGPRQVTGAAYSFVSPTPVSAPRLLHASPEVAASLGLDPASLGRAPWLDVLAGNALLPGMQPYAACYGGHQFGRWAGQLGDGRAISLGELIGPDGRRNELQLKGAGVTPYSRRADGRAVLRSSLREYLCSEAMHHAGVPTTRALSLVATGDEVMRDVLYSGHPALEPGAIVARVAPSFLRFGTLELFASRGDVALLKRTVDYLIRTHYPQVWPTDGAPTPEVYAAWLVELAQRTGVLFAHFMRIGFVHGVLNTDNMSLLGITLDYGPYGFLEGYDPDFTPNTTDAREGRYRYGNQPRIGAWNVARLAEAMSLLIDDKGALEAAVAAYATSFEAADRAMLAGKLGLDSLVVDEGSSDDDGPLVESLFALLVETETDMSIFFRRLAELPLADEAYSAEGVLTPLVEALYNPSALRGAYQERLLAFTRALAARARRDGVDDAARRARMNAHNPKFVLRNWLAQRAIEAAEAGDLAPLNELAEVMRRPYDDQPGREAFAEKRPEWARHRIGCSMLSCSS